MVYFTHTASLLLGSEETDENLVDTKKGISCYTGIRLSGSNLHQDSYALTECSPESGCMDVEASVVLGTSTKGLLCLSLWDVTVVSVDI